MTQAPRPGGSGPSGRRGPRKRGPAPRGQADAVNRSRPIYDSTRRPGRPAGPARPGDARRPGQGTGRRPAPGARFSGPPEAEERRGPAMPSDPREAALRILFEVETRSAFSDRLLDVAHGAAAANPDAKPADQALLHELVKGTLRWRGRIDWALDQRVHIGLGQVTPWIRNVLRLGAYQLLFLDRVPAHAAVDESVKLATKYGHPGTAGLVNSVLRRLAEEGPAIEWPAGDDVASLAVFGSHPEWMVSRWLERFGADATRALLLANNAPARLGLRVNALKGTRDQLIARLADEGVRAEPAAFAADLVWIDGNHAPMAIRAFRDGACTAQDESECLVARLLAPQTHERVLDLCAAPGGKCTHIAELIGDEGEVWAMERQAVRIGSIEQNLKRLGLHSVHVVEGDGRRYAFPMPFDRVLVDAPCSGLGVLGRRADARWRKTEVALDDMPPVQLDLLLAAAQHARPGGVIVYSVCSFEPEETDHVVERLLRESPSLVLESAHGLLPDAVVDEQGFMRVLPHVHGCDGAFAARFRKT